VKGQSKIGERINYKTEAGNLEVSISGKIPKWQESLLFFWVLAWSLCGIFIVQYLFGDWPRDQKLFLVVYLAFWAFFEYKAVHAWLWRKFGFESIIVKDGQLFLKNNILDKGKTIKYFTQNIKDFGWLSSNPKSFGNVYFKSFWLVGGETIGFVHFGQKVTFGMQLEEREAAKLIGLIRKHFKK